MRNTSKSQETWPVYLNSQIENLRTKTKMSQNDSFRRSSVNASSGRSLHFLEVGNINTSFCRTLHCLEVGSIETPFGRSLHCLEVGSIKASFGR